jgi:hypothetical protein
MTATGLEQTPVTGLQVPAVWQASLEVQTTEFEPVQVPAWQESVCVQALPSLQEAPFAATGLLQTPFEGLQVPTLWHWSLAVQVTGFEPVQVPAWQVSVCVQALPSLQEVPFGTAGLGQEPVEELQIPTLWHWSLAVQVTGFEPTQAPA